MVAAVGVVVAGEGPILVLRPFLLHGVEKIRNQALHTV